MAASFYVSIDGKTQGAFKGDVTHPGFGQGKIRGLDFSYEAEAPHFAGRASGRRDHGPFVLTKAWDAATPQIFHAFVTNELLTTVLFEFFAASAGGQESLFQTVELENATISKLHWYLPEDARPASAHAVATGVPEREDVSFSFETIKVENVAAKTAAIDSWAVV